MDTLRTKILAAFLIGMLCTLGVQFVRDWVGIVNARLDSIEQYLAGQELMRQMGVQPQMHEEKEPSHKGELSLPERWKV